MIKRIFNFVPHFQRLRLAALRVGRPFSSFIGPFIPDILAQNDLRRFQALPPFLSLLGGVVTAVLMPKCLAPLRVKPAPDSVER